MPCALSVFLEKRIINFSKLYIFLYANVARIYQSSQNPTFRVSLENGKNDPIQKDEIKYLWLKIVSNSVFLFRQFKPLQNISV